LTGAAGGLANGLLVTRAKVNALITTLATMGVFRGLAVLVGGTSIANLPAEFTPLRQAEWLGVQAPVWLVLGLAAARPAPPPPPPRVPAFLPQRAHPEGGRAARHPGRGDEGGRVPAGGADRGLGGGRVPRAGRPARPPRRRGGRAARHHRRDPGRGQP